MTSNCINCNVKFSPYSCSETNDGPFVYLNFRGNVKYIGRDILENVPYLNILINFFV